MTAIRSRAAPARSRSGSRPETPLVTAEALAIVATFDSSCAATWPEAPERFSMHLDRVTAHLWLQEADAVGVSRTRMVELCREVIPSVQRRAKAKGNRVPRKLEVHSQDVMDALATLVRPLPEGRAGMAPQGSAAGMRTWAIGSGMRPAG